MRNLSKTILAVLATGLLSCGLFCQQTQAFEGSVSFFGAAHADHNSTQTGPATHITFDGAWSVIANSGDYATGGGSIGSVTTMHDFAFMGTGDTVALMPGSPMQPEWMFVSSGNGHTYSFELLALTNGSVTAGSMSFSGTGLAFKDGGDASVASWALQGSGGKFTFKFSSSTTTAVPDGGSAVALLGIALAGIEVVRRKVKAKAA